MSFGFGLALTRARSAGGFFFGGWATTYIPTTSAAVARDADLIRPAAGFVTDGPQTIRVRFAPDKAASGSGQYLVSRGNGYPLYLGSDGKPAMYDETVAITGASVIADGVTASVVTAWSGAAMKLSMNGASVVSGAFDGTMGTGSTVYFGCLSPGTQEFSGDIISIESVAALASDAQMPQLSAGIL